MRISPTGRKAWGVRVHKERKSKQMNIGIYPKMGLNEARWVRRELLGNIELELFEPYIYRLGTTMTIPLNHAGKGYMIMTTIWRL